MPTAAVPDMRNATSAKDCVAEWAWLGRVAYGAALRLQEQARDEVADGARDLLLMLEHDPVITLGRAANVEHVLAPAEALSASGISVVRTSRGGDVTMHGPGQLTGYPIFRLRRGVRAHIRAMADGIAAVLSELGIAAEWRESTPGLWVGQNKICAFGVHVRRRVAMHGFALNMNNDLDCFQMIVPCGLRQAGVTSTAALLGFRLDLAKTAQQIARAFEQSFESKFVCISASSSRLQIANGNQ
jgi:lipoyl(octanoyl) transferase